MFLNHNKVKNKTKQINTTLSEQSRNSQVCCEFEHG